MVGLVLLGGPKGARCPFKVVINNYGIVFYGQ